MALHPVKLINAADNGLWLLSRMGGCTKSMSSVTWLNQSSSGHQGVKVPHWSGITQIVHDSTECRPATDGRHVTNRSIVQQMIPLLMLTDIPKGTMKIPKRHNGTELIEAAWKRGCERTQQRIILHLGLSNGCGRHDILHEDAHTMLTRTWTENMVKINTEPPEDTGGSQTVTWDWTPMKVCGLEKDLRMEPRTSELHPFTC